MKVKTPGRTRIGLGPFSIHPFSYNIKFSHLLGVYIMVIGLSGVQFNL